MLKDFFSSQATHAPSLSLLGHFACFIFCLALILLALFQHEKSRFSRFFQGLQWIQLISLYGWYVATQAPLSESLPLYHCRLAMLSLLLLPKHWLLKRYFAYLGVAGSILAFVYPVFDPFPLFHVTTFSFIFGHAALLVNSLVYLLDQGEIPTLQLRFIVRTTVIINLLQLCVNAVTGGNYGFLCQTPIIGGTDPMINVMVVTTVLSFLVGLVQWTCLHFQGQGKLLHQEKI
ncbi:YwaF family protein [Streptococcus rupicaprae]|uniref:YwaF family protein n=1 Tax=Streptococcus rupicaprae TaxID=759619 RepID=UPI00339358D5